MAAAQHIARSNMTTISNTAPRLTCCCTTTGQSQGRCGAMERAHWQGQRQKTEWQYRAHKRGCCGCAWGMQGGAAELEHMAH